MSNVFWDTNLFIYLIEDYEDLSEKVASLKKRMNERNDKLYTSSLTLGEILVKPVEEQEESLVRQYQDTLKMGTHLLSFDEAAAVQYARIRRDRSIRPPDAIQLACAAAAGMDLFITNDERLSQKSVKGIHFITSLERARLLIDPPEHK
ncbi:MAG: PIN domain-containing protein [bacterium]|nr:PIN domain-containing protein [bacterium]